MITLTEKILNDVIQPRPAESFKGTYGHALIIGGNETYGGAGIMSATAALYSGAGLVTLASAAVNRTALHARQPEIMFLDWQQTETLQQLIQKADVIVIGPGLGLEEHAWQLLQSTLVQLTKNQVIIIDGSALTLLAQKKTLPQTAAQIILTPHQAEWQRLSQIAIAKQEPQRNQKALAAFPAHTILVLKQHRTEIYQNNQIYRNSTGVPAMAVGGMGDTLTGVIAALIAQFKKPLPATLAAVYLHSLAGQRLAQKQYVALPTQMIQLIPQLMQEFA